MKETIKKHKRIIFNGNNYSDEWVAEAEKRGLYNLKTTVDALPKFVSPENIALFEKHKILSECEIRSRYEIIIDTYSKVLNIEALTLLDMAKRDILPAALKYSTYLADSIKTKAAIGGIDYETEKELASTVSSLAGCLYKNIEKLDKVLLGAKDIEGTLEIATYYAHEVFEAMQNVRAVADELETMVAAEYWPIPTYSDLLFSV